jgi:CubicO group peptidase (beta-lactamase class C family)
VLVRIKEDGTFETRPAKRAITVRHLLTHTSGIGYGFSSPTVAAMQKGTMRPETELPLLFDPGDGWAYGASTRVLGELVARVSGEALDTFLARRILQPLGMRDTGYAVAASSMGRVVSSHTRTADGFTERQPGATASSGVAGDGGLYSTAGDYARFLQMLLNEGRTGSTRLLEADTVRTLFRNHTGRVVVQRQETTNRGLSLPFPEGAGRDTWGLGFQLSNPATKSQFRRDPGSGTWAGIFNTHFWIDPSKEVGVIAMMQLLPFYDEKAMALLGAIEEQVYRHLK